MKLIIEIGNSSTKLAIFESRNIINNQIIHDLSTKVVLSFIRDFSISGTIISSVRKKNNIIDELIMYFKALFLTHKTKIPIKNSYKTSETLGKDRLAAIVGANDIYPDKNILVIDAGTCLTGDYFVDGKYYGGRISPGIQMRYNSLQSFTDKLPKLTIVDVYSKIGNNTNSSIIAGVQQGIVDEVDALINLFREENKETIVIVTGGDYRFFEKHLKNSIFVDPFIVLKGLNIILEFNAKK